MCSCIERINKDLESDGQCLDATMFGHRKVTTMLIRKDKWKHENRRNKPTRFIATYCPFCGDKYPIGDREVDQSVSLPSQRQE